LHTLVKCKHTTKTTEMCESKAGSNSTAGFVDPM